MEASAKAILKIDKTNWTPVKFGDVVFEPKENAKDIYNEGIEHVVGLEHIDTENIHLTRSGKLEESTTFSKKFKKGDVLFGRRRAYLKKAALADFDGICSGDITVFRAKKNLLPKLLPFIVNNEKFFDYAVKHSAGGLSPRVKFKDLANFEFLLPPKDQQAQLAELLWALDEVIEREREAQEKMSDLKLTRMHEMLNGKHFINNNESYPADWQPMKLKNIAKFIDYRGKTPPKKDSGVRLITAKNIRDGWIDIIPEEFISIVDYESWMRRGIPQNGDVLFTTEAPLGNTALIDFNEPFALAQRVVCLQPKDKINGNFLFFTLSNPEFVASLKSKATGTTVLGIRSSLLKEIEILVPPLAVQKDIVEVLFQIVDSISSLKIKIESSQSLQKSLINLIF